MRKIIHILLLLFPVALMAQKKDFIRTPNNNNIIVDWNLKSYTLNIPHGTTPSLRGAPDSTGYLFVQDSVTVRRLRFYAGGTWRTILGSDSVSIKVNRDFSNVAPASIPINKLASNTISGITLGGSLASLTATDATLSFSGSYNGSIARTAGINLGNANTWSGTQTFSSAVFAGTALPDANNTREFGSASLNYSAIRARQVLSNAGLVLGAGAGNTIPFRINNITYFQINTDGSITSSGIDSYAADYSASFTARSKVDKGYVDAQISGNAPIVLTANATLALNTQYALNSASQLQLTLPSTAGFAADGKKTINVTASASGGGKILVPNGYQLRGISGATKTDGTGYISFLQYQQVLIKPDVVANTYIYQVLSGSVTVF